MRLRSLSRAATALIVGLLSFAPPLWAQTALTTTTLGAAVTDTAGTVVTVASATGITAPGTGNTLVFLLVDREIMAVRSVTGTTIGVARGQNSTKASTHINASVVTIAPGLAITSSLPAGQCTRTNLLYVPLIVGGGVGLGSEVGSTFDCLGVTTAGQWVQTNGNGYPTLGSTVASPNGVMTPTGVVFTVSGTNAITGILAPAGLGVGFNLYIVPSGVFTWTAATNIALAGTAVVNKTLIFTWNGSKWVPSYIA